jgi:hypothetical protein
LRVQETVCLAGVLARPRHKEMHRLSMKPRQISTVHTSIDRQSSSAPPPEAMAFDSCPFYSFDLRCGSLQLLVGQESQKSHQHSECRGRARMRIGRLFLPFLAIGRCQYPYVAYPAWTVSRLDMLWRVKTPCGRELSAHVEMSKTALSAARKPSNPRFEAFLLGCQSRTCLLSKHIGFWFRDLGIYSRVWGFRRGSKSLFSGLSNRAVSSRVGANSGAASPWITGYGHLDSKFGIIDIHLDSDNKIAYFRRSIPLAWR